MLQTNEGLQKMKSSAIMMLIAVLLKGCVMQKDSPASQPSSQTVPYDELLVSNPYTFDKIQDYIPKPASTTGPSTSSQTRTNDNAQSPPP
jgi:hypothetical protein